MENCCGVNAFGNILNKRAIQDSFRVYDFSPTEYNKVSKEILNERPIVETIMENGQLKDRYMRDYIESDVDFNFKKAIDVASKITGNVRQAGTHAAGMIITPKGLDMFRKLPVMITGGKLNSQYDKNDVEYAGFLKMDLLGIRNLDIIQDTMDYVKKYRGIDINIRAIPLDDDKTFMLYRSGDTSFVFQVESGGMKNFLKKLQPTNMEDIICVLAGYRPGPMAYLEQYVKVRNGQEDAVYRHELLRPILEVTGGISFYQEQVMDIFRVLAGYSLGRADLVRRALGKKKKAILDQERHNFIYGIQAKDEKGNLLFEEDGTTPVMEVNGCINNGIDEETASLIYEDIIPFADYGFNKSHAAGYAILSYRTAYLKANYFLEYATSVLKSVQNDKKRLTEYATLIKGKGVEIYFPCVNKSSKDMDIYDFDKGIITTGLMAISGLPEEMAGCIVEERENGGDFTSYTDFLDRMMSYNIDAKTMKALIGSGAFDVFDKNTNRLLSQYEHIHSSHIKKQEFLSQHIKSIFDMKEFSDAIEFLDKRPDDNGYNLQDRLSALCESNNVGIHMEVTSAYKNVRNELVPDKWQRAPEFESKRGVVTAILENDFEPSKKGKAYLTKAIGFNGDVFKLIVSKSKVEEITNDITKFKKGMAIDVYGSFRFPVPNETDSEDEKEQSGFDDNEIVCFPKDIQIKELDTPWIATSVVLDFDEMKFEKETVANYYGVESFDDAVVNILDREESENGKVITIKRDGIAFKAPHRIDVEMDELHKLGCTCYFA